MELIDKSALVAEIEREKEKCGIFYDIALSNNAELAKVAIEEQERQYNSLLSFIDTLQTKEVDFEKYYHDFLQKEWFNLHVRTVSEMMAFTAKHFFELGLSISNESQKGEEV